MAHARAASLGAFTLIKLLVVIAILVSLPLPVLSKAHRKAERISCLNNLKWIGPCIRFYTEDD